MIPNFEIRTAITKDISIATSVIKNQQISFTIAWIASETDGTRNKMYNNSLPPLINEKVKKNEKTSSPVVSFGPNKPGRQRKHKIRKKKLQSPKSDRI